MARLTAESIPGAVGALYLAGTVVAVGLIAYLMLRPRAAYAQPGRPPAPPGTPALPGPGVPPIQPTADSALPPNYHPPYESSGRPVSEFPMYSVVRLATPLAGRDGPIYKLIKVGTERDRHDYTDPYTWRGFGFDWEATGTTYADIQTIDNAAPIAEVVDRNGRLLWAPGMTPGLTYRDTEYVR